MRIDKYLIHSGLSKKEVTSLIKEERILLNDQVLKSHTVNIDENIDMIKIDGKTIEYKEFHYIIINKPEGYVCASSDKDNPTIVSLLKGYENIKLNPVGRLDKDTTGLVLLTNNKSLLHFQANPKNLITKEYLVEVNHPLKEELIAKFKEGIDLGDFTTRSASLIFIDEYHTYITLDEGKFHEIKRMFDHFGYEVMKLHRTRIGFLELSNLKPGEYQELTKEQILQIESDINK